MVDARTATSVDGDPRETADFSRIPYVVFYEVTQACDLACLHCRASAQACHDPAELSTIGAMRLLDQLAIFSRKPNVVLTGGDPMKRPDLAPLVEHGVSLGLEMALTPSATDLVRCERLCLLAAAGLSRLAVSLDGPDAYAHDRFRRARGSFERTLGILRDARQTGLSLQVNTTVTRFNWRRIDEFAEVLAGQQILHWSVFFLVPVGRARADDCLSAGECEAAFAMLWRQSQRQQYAIKTTEAPHYRRFVLQHRKLLNAARKMPLTSTQRPSLNVNDGRGAMFIGHTGRIQPSGFLPLHCRRFPGDSVVDDYQNSPVFRALRNTDGLGGKCGCCEYRRICGGSRARAFALTGDYLAEEPHCFYMPTGRQVDVLLETEAGRLSCCANAERSAASKWADPHDPPSRSRGNSAVSPPLRGLGLPVIDRP